ncbi:MAG: hypothetical protein DRP12_00195 [Candidatus Aenigmatarchaeota archaeon]|nr:MAG: hypothetical protein DRP12_00195 [Candidatus Aenigmarchaeota archaeon]
MVRIKGMVEVEMKFSLTGKTFQELEEKAKEIAKKVLEKRGINLDLEDSIVSVGISGITETTYGLLYAEEVFVRVSRGFGWLEVEE